MRNSLVTTANLIPKGYLSMSKSYCFFIAVLFRCELANSVLSDSYNFTIHLLKFIPLLKICWKIHLLNWHTGQIGQIYPNFVCCLIKKHDFEFQLVIFQKKSLDKSMKAHHVSATIMIFFTSESHFYTHKTWVIISFENSSKKLRKYYNIPLHNNLII